MLKKLSLLLAILICFVSLPGHGQEEDEQFLEEVQKEREKQIRTAKQLNEMKANLEATKFDPYAEIKKLGHKGITAKALTDVKVLKILKKMMEESGLKNAPKEQVKKSILTQLNPRAREFFENHPKLLNISVDVLRDQKAMSSLINILMRKDDLKLYAVIYILLILFSWLTKKLFFKKTWSKTKTFSLGLALSLTVTFVSLATFYNLFQQDLTPIVTIVSTHWDN